MAGLSFEQRYQVLGELSRGGMGVVYKAEDRQLGRLVALKVMLGQSRENLEMVRRFQREAEVLAQLQHRHVVKVHDFGWVRSQPFLSMSYLQGQSLQQVLEQNLKETGEPLSLERAVEFLAPIAEALVLCHERGIVHRDLKPANIFLESETGRPVLLDFGVVKLGFSKESLSDPLTKTGDALGTPQFMAPEQFEVSASRPIDGKTDVWGLAATLFMLVTGEAVAESETLVGLYKAILFDSLRPASSVNEALPLSLDQFLERCFAKDSRERPTMQDFAAQLRAGFDRSAPVPRRAKLVPVGLVVVLLSVLASVVLASFAASPPRLLRAQAPELSAGKRVVIEGQVSGLASGAVVQVDDQAPMTLGVTAEGLFRRRLSLSEGAHRVQVYAENAFGTRSEVQTLSLELDLTKPRLRVLEKPEVIYEASLRVKMEASEPLTIVEGLPEPMTLGQGEQFVELPIKGYGKQVLRLQFQDRVGHSGRISLGVTRRRSFYVGPKELALGEYAGVFSSLDSALAAMGAEQRLVIGARRLEFIRHQTLVIENKSLLIEGLVVGGERPVVAVRQTAQLVVENSKLSFRKLDFVCPNSLGRHSEAVHRDMLSLKSGRLEFRECRFAKFQGNVVAHSIHSKAADMSVAVKDCVFEDNYSSVLHGLRASQWVMQDCQFRRNWSVMKVIVFESLRVSGCVFEGNQLGFDCKDGRSLVMEDCRFVGQGLNAIILKKVDSVRLKRVSIKNTNLKKDDESPVAIKARTYQSFAGEDVVIDGVFGHGFFFESGEGQVELRGCRVTGCYGSGKRAFSAGGGRVLIADSVFEKIGQGPSPGDTDGVVFTAETKGSLRNVTVRGVSGRALVSNVRSRMVLNNVTLAKNGQDIWEGQGAKVVKSEDP